MMGKIFRDGVFYADIQDAHKALSEIQETIQEINRLMTKAKGPAIYQLREWKKVGKKMIELLKMQHELISATEDTIQRLDKKSNERAHKKWTNKEDETLIELACRENIKIIDMMTALGRSPMAIKNRLSYLVGVKRVSQEIAGKFIGTLNGANIEGDIRGKLQKNT